MRWWVNKCSYKTDLKHATLKVSESIGKINRAQGAPTSFSTVSKVGKGVRSGTRARLWFPRRRCVSGALRASAKRSDPSAYIQAGVGSSARLVRSLESRIYKSPQKEPFSRTQQKSRSIKETRLQPALSWAAVNRDALNSQGTSRIVVLDRGSGDGPAEVSLKLRLHKLNFIDLLTKEQNGGRLLPRPDSLPSR